MNNQDHWKNVYSNMLLNEAEKQSSIQISKKSKAKSKTAEKGLSPERMKELATHDARREIRTSEAKKINKSVASPSKLNDAEKERLKNRMESSGVEKKVEKLSKIKLKEKQLAQKEKNLRKQSKETADKNNKERLLAMADTIKAELETIRSSYKKSKKEEAPKEEPKKDLKDDPKKN